MTHLLQSIGIDRINADLLSRATPLKRVHVIAANDYLVSCMRRPTRIPAHLDHCVGWIDTETGSMALTFQPYWKLSHSDLGALSRIGLTVLDVPESHAPYRTSPGAPLTCAYLLCTDADMDRFNLILNAIS